MKKLILISFLLIQINCFAEKDGGFSAEITLSNSEINIDNYLIIDVNFSFPDGYRVNLDTIRGNLLMFSNLTLAPFALIEEKIIQQDNRRLSLQYTLEPMVAGVHNISLYNIPFISDDNIKEIISDISTVNVLLTPPLKDYQGFTYPLISLTDQIPIEMDRSIRDYLFDDPKLNELEKNKNITHLQQKQIPYERIIAIAILAIIFLIIRQYPKELPSKEKEIAFRFFRAKSYFQFSLGQLKQRKLIQRKDYDEYYLFLTNTFKKYLEDRFQIKASTKTTEEIIAEIDSRKNFDPKTKTEVATFLRKSDLIKFAKYSSSGDECNKASNIANKILSS